MKKTLISIIAAALLLSSGGTEFEAAKKKVTKPKTKKVASALTISNPNTSSNVVFYIPHQDDEALTFGVGIMNHLMNGHNVHVVLLTDGSASGVRAKLGMTEADFTAARNREFAKSLQIMGVKPENVSYENIKDGTLTVAQSEAVIRRYEAKFPNAKHKTFSHTDEHSDHANLGLALQKLNKAGVATDARYYLRRGSNPAGYVITTEAFQEYYRPFLLAVSAAYNIENTRLGFYGIGHKSVAASFAAFDAQPSSRYHK